MKKIYPMLFTVLSVITLSKAQVCDTTGNVIIYSNYDGGILNINVDQNIPNLKIGVVTYEAVRIQILGQYASNVTELRYAGYNGTNDNCNLGVNSVTVSGVPTNAYNIVSFPLAGYSNVNGDPNIVCNYSCSSTTNQGGCNTPDQLVYYFLNAFGGTFRYHDTQYNCWNNSAGYNVSAGGNCCIVPTTLGLENISTKKEKYFFPNPSKDELNIRFYTNADVHEVELFNMLGEKVLERSFSSETEKAKIDCSELTKGMYLLKLKEGSVSSVEKIIIE